MTDESTIGRQRQAALLLVLWQKPERGAEAHCRVRRCSFATSVLICATILFAKKFKKRQSKGRALNCRSLKRSIEFLNEYVIGQQQAKRVLAVAVYNHYKRLRNARPAHTLEDVELSKSNICWWGRPGPVKHLLAETLARLLDVPFTIADATTLLRRVMWVKMLKILFRKLLQKVRLRRGTAQMGIVYIDEIDKISTKVGQPLYHPRRVRGGRAASSY